MNIHTYVHARISVYGHYVTSTIHITMFTYIYMHMFRTRHAHRGTFLKAFVRFPNNRWEYLHVSVSAIRSPREPRARVTTEIRAQLAHATKLCMCALRSLGLDITESKYL